MQQPGKPKYRKQHNRRTSRRINFSNNVINGSKRFKSNY